VGAPRHEPSGIHRTVGAHCARIARFALPEYPSHRSVRSCRVPVVPMSGHRTHVYGRHVPDDHSAAMQRVSMLLREQGHVPDEVRPEVQSLLAEWESGSPDLAVLSHGRAVLWAYLEAKHGDSTTITDAYDRTVRAAICLAEPPGQNHAADLEEWAQRMLG